VIRPVIDTMPIKKMVVTSTEPLRSIGYNARTPDSIEINTTELMVILKIGKMRELPISSHFSRQVNCLICSSFDIAPFSF
jgi:hypothetical protein